MSWLLIIMDYVYSHKKQLMRKTNFKILISAHVKNGGNVKTCKQDLKTYLNNLALY